MIFENLRFRPSTRRREASLLKNLHSRDRFENLLFWCSKTPFTCGQKGKTAKNLPSQEYLDTYGWGLYFLSLCFYYQCMRHSHDREPIKFDGLLS